VRHFSAIPLEAASSGADEWPMDSFIERTYLGYAWADHGLHASSVNRRCVVWARSSMQTPCLCKGSADCVRWSLYKRFCGTICAHVPLPWHPMACGGHCKVTAAW